MGLNLQLQALTLPDGTEFPGTMQLLQNLVAQYLSITGQGDFTGINYGPTTPDASNRDRPWFKTDNSFLPLGWYAWDGAAWTRIQLLPQSGAFADAPTGSGAGQLYYATDINVLCLWNGAAWVTADGASGEIRFVRGTDIGDILTKYPGWVQVTDIAAQTIAVAGDGTGSGFSDRDPETTVGEEEHTQTLNELVGHAHGIVIAPTRTGTAGANPIWANDANGTTDSAGGGQPFNIMQPTRFLYCIQKS